MNFYLLPAPQSPVEQVLYRHPHSNQLVIKTILSSNNYGRETQFSISAIQLTYIYIKEFADMENKLNFVCQIFFFCHQRPERSFYYKGNKFPICARCTGMAIGYLLSIILLIFTGLLNLWMIALLMLPMAIDGTGQLFGKWTSTNFRRLLTGLPGGIGVIFIYYHFGYQVFLFGQYVGRHFEH